MHSDAWQDMLEIHGVIIDHFSQDFPKKYFEYNGPVSELIKAKSFDPTCFSTIDPWLNEYKVESFRVTDDVVIVCVYSQGKLAESKLDDIYMKAIFRIVDQKLEAVRSEWYTPFEGYQIERNPL